MGTYLSTPVLDKETDEGEDLDCAVPVAWGVVDMQGWRKTMEDAHVAQTDISPPPFAKNVTGHAKVFAVFDGHGGAEVARFCQLYLVDVLTHEKYWTDENVDVGKALVGAFHSLDCLIDCPERRNEINRLETKKPGPRERRCVDSLIEANNANESDSNESNSPANDEDEDSDAVVGEVDDDRLDDDEDDDDDDINEQADDSSKNPIILFRKLLNTVQVKKKLEGITNSDQKSDEGNSNEEENEQVVTPTKIVNGRPMCNLSDHPIHAGCTAVCAVIVGNTLTVANAGDSRVVLCRENGVTEAMSFDHKPMDDIEMERIKKAGGFVNQFGRVNGNLNLSRSIGDLKYKQVPNIGPADQMITAEPDIKSVILNENDEFVILACDGIWDCLTNEEAVKYVRDRIDNMTPIEIGTEMLDQIVSIDPRETQGIGGDNMTIMIVDLQPLKRNYRNK